MLFPGSVEEIHLGWNSLILLAATSRLGQFVLANCLQLVWNSLVWIHLWWVDCLMLTCMFLMFAEWNCRSGREYRPNSERWTDRLSGCCRYGCLPCARPCMFWSLCVKFWRSLKLHCRMYLWFYWLMNCRGCRQPALCLPSHRQG